MPDGSRTPWWQRIAKRVLLGAYRAGSVLERALPSTRSSVPLPPLHLRMYYYRTASHEAFLRFCDNARNELVSRGLRPEHRIVDIGSGIGNLAIGLRDFSTAPYRGFDVHREAVAWCREHITAVHPLFRFDHVDVASVAYNPRGSEISPAFGFPVEDASADFVYLGSVITHLLPDIAERYVEEVSRMLAPGGRCVLTCFLIDDERRDAVERGLPFLSFPVVHPSGVCRLHDARTPEAAVAFEGDFLRTTFARHGLDVGDLRRGDWWQGKAHDHDVYTLIKL